MRKVVVNTKYGGFSLSNEAKMALYKRKHPEEEFFYYMLGDDLNYHKYQSTPKEDDVVDLILTKDLGNKIMYESMNEDYSDCILSDCILSDDYDNRHDPDLVAVVEELGKKAFGPYARLEIIEIEDDDKYVIDEYDGWETLVLKSQIEDWDWK